MFTLKRKGKKAEGQHSHIQKMWGIRTLMNDVQNAIPLPTFLPLFSSPPFLPYLSPHPPHPTFLSLSPILFSSWLQSTRASDKDPSSALSSVLWWCSSVSWQVWWFSGDIFREVIYMTVLERVKENLGKEKILSIMDIDYLTKSIGSLSEPKGGKNYKPKFKEHFPEKLTLRSTSEVPVGCPTHN